MGGLFEVPQEERGLTFPEQLLQPKPALIQPCMREMGGLWAPLTDRGTEAPRGTRTCQASQLVTQDSPGPSTSFKEGHVPQSGRAGSAQPAKSSGSELQEAGWLCSGPWLFPQATSWGGVPYLISEMSFSSVSHRAWVWGSAGPSMAGRHGWGREGVQGADSTGTGIQCEWQRRLPPGGTRQVPTSTPKGRGSTQPVLPAATHASNRGERPGGSHPSPRVGRRGGGQS